MRERVGIRERFHGRNRGLRGCLSAILATIVVSAAVSAQSSATPRRIHSADQSGDVQLSLSELLRVVQFFNMKGYFCDVTPEDSPDGYQPGIGTDTACERHSSDYADPAWRIELGELLRAVQFFNMGGYHACPNDGTADGFCPGPFPNVVFILLDATRADAVGGSRNGIPIMPYLDHFASEGIRFTKAVPPSSWTRPSMLSLNTGLFPNAFQGGEDSLPQDRYSIGDAIEIMPEWFSSYGFDTWGWSTNDNCSEPYGFAQGYASGHFSVIGFVKSGDVVDVVLQKLASARPPFFYYVHFVDSHGPHDPPADYLNHFGVWPVMTAADQNTLLPTNYFDFQRDALAAWAFGDPRTYPALTAGGVDGLHYYYEAETSYLDSQLERLIAAILAQYPNTIFVITADHGEELYEDGALGHAPFLSENVTHVPFILHGPGIAPAVIEYPVSTLGMLNTMAGLLRLPDSDQWQGADMLTDPGDAPIFVHTRTNIQNRFDMKGSVVREGHFKLVDCNRQGTPQLFDLDADPGELTDVSAEHPDIFQLLQQQLAEHLAQFVK